jgi:hypothetical protein
VRWCRTGHERHVDADVGTDALRPGPTGRLRTTRSRRVVAKGSEPAAVVTAALATCAALLGLVAPELLPGRASTTEILRAYDVLTLVVAPALIWCAARRYPGSWERVLVVALLTYLTCTYAYHLLGGGPNGLFVVHAGMVGVGITALVMAGGDGDRRPPRDGARPGDPDPAVLRGGSTPQASAPVGRGGRPTKANGVTSGAARRFGWVVAGGRG